MKPHSPPSAGEVFSMRQYSNKTLMALHLALLNNPDARQRGTDENAQLSATTEEMIRRGMRP